jgi:hypothetical protein
LNVSANREMTVRFGRQKEALGVTRQVEVTATFTGVMLSVADKPIRYHVLAETDRKSPGHDLIVNYMGDLSTAKCE